MKFASMEDPFPRGTFMGKQVTGPRLSEAEHFRKCPLCGGHVDSAIGLGSANIGSHCRTQRAIGRNRQVPCSARPRLTTAHQINPPVNDSV